MMGALHKNHPTVSAHAVIRYVQRVRGVIVPVEEKRFTAPFAMYLHLYAAGITLDQVEAEILTPAVVSAINAGAASLVIGAGRLRVRNRNVTTIVDTAGSSPYRPSWKRFPRDFRESEPDDDMAVVR